MEDTSDSSGSKSKYSLLKWILIIIFGFAGFGMLFESPFGGLALLAAAAILIPKVSAFIETKIHRTFPTGAKVVLVLALVAISGSTLPDPTPTVSTDAPVAVAETSASATQTPAQDSQAKEKAEEELKAFMDLSIQATLVSSYEFSESANVVYVGSIWYSQTAIQKKDFLAYVAKAKKEATGYHHFEVHDAYTDEKVAEVTAFSGALKVYK